MYVIICETDRKPDSMHETGCLGLVHWDDPERWDGEVGGKGDHDGGFMSMYGKINTTV